MSSELEVLVPQHLRAAGLECGYIVSLGLVVLLLFCVVLTLRLLCQAVTLYHLGLISHMDRRCSQ